MIDDYLFGELKRWQARQAENEKQFGGKYICVYREEIGHIAQQQKSFPISNAEKVSLVCVASNGQPVLYNRLARMLRKEGLNALSFRHTHATVLTEYGANPEVISGRLGHKNPQLTQDVYVHNTPKMQEDAVAVFTKILQGKS